MRGGLVAAGRGRAQGTRAQGVGALRGLHAAGDAVSTGPDGPIELVYGHEPWTTATHLDRALGRLTERSARVRTGARGGDPSSESDQPLLWAETGVPWLPSLERLTRSLSACYLIDTHRGIGWRGRLAGAFDVVFVAQGDAVEPLAEAGLDVHWLPLAAPADLCVDGPRLADRPYDVAFVGQAPRGSLRAAVLDALRSRCAVAPTPSYVAPPDMMQLYASARVVVNLPLARDLNMRVFEATGAGSLLVTGPCNRLDRVLPAGSYELVEHRTVAAWVDAVERALADPDAQDRADRAHERVMAEHTYDHRVAAVCEALAASSRRPVSTADRAAALGAAYARWGRPGPTVRLALPAGIRARLVTEAASWQVATTGVRTVRRLRRRAAGLHPERSLPAS